MEYQKINNNHHFAWIMPPTPNDMYSEYALIWRAYERARVKRCGMYVNASKRK